MDAFLTSTAVVALAEVGDKTQLLAILLATRLKRPVPIIFGILAATIANHFLAALVGAEAASFLDGKWFRILIGVSFVAMGLWTLIPDTFEDEENRRPARSGAFLTTLIAFFLVEMGDKTQLATIALAARFHTVAAVTAGTTLGMLIANVPAVLLGEAAARKLPMRVVHGIAAAIFLVLGLSVLFGLGSFG
jgi:putative Ca2+/H+ antiporter (TMEM165/GDT1 family)